jgi:coatomer subunit beta'
MRSLGSSTPKIFNEKGVNYVNFYLAADKPYLVTTGDDKTLKVWDFLSKSCVQTIEGRTNNISFAVSGIEDGTVKISTYRIETRCCH